ISVPTSHALTKLVGEQIRDWQVKPDGARQLLTVEFIKPVEKNYALTLYSEQTVDNTAASTSLVPPEPIEESLQGRVPRVPIQNVPDPIGDSRSSSLQRESGTFTISADDTLVEIDTATGLRQVNASGGAIAAYRFHGRPIELTAKLKRIEPLVKVADRATVRLEETRLLVSHALSLNVERAGIYSLDLTPQTGFAVSEVRGDGVEDWKLADGTLRVTFTNRVLGARNLAVQLEQALKQFPESIVIAPLAVVGSTNLSVQIGAASPGGIRLKTSELLGLREVPVTTLSARGGDELLAFTGDQQNWKLTLATEKLSARVVAEVFDLISIGEGLVGGSATIRYGIFNQGVQEFRVTLPAHWRNIEFTGPNIRRKEQAAAPAAGASNVWTIALQDKAWGAYTLVVTYDYQFDPKGALLDLSGAHALNVERETGSAGVMSAGGLKLEAKPISEPLRRVDESELLDTDRALATRPLLLAFKYTGTNYALAVQVTRFEQITGLDAIADRTELTSVLNEQGQMLTQASFMMKNNEKQFQRFKLPAGAEFWSSYVNGQPAKPEKDGEWILVPLPRQANRDLAFAVDIVYAQKIDLQKSKLPQAIALRAPLTDVPNTYAEWQLFVPMSQRLSSFGGNMMVAPYTTYELRDAWREFVQFWGNAIDRHLGMLAFGCVLVGFISLVVIAMQRGAKGVVSAIAVIAIVCILASMMLPALSRAKSRAQRISATSNLKQIGLAARLYANDHGGKFPNSFEEMRDELVTDKVLIDPSTGQRFTWIGAGKTEEMPDLVIAYSRSENGGVVALADGSVQQVSSDQLDAMLRRDGKVTLGVALAASGPARPPVAAQPTVAFANTAQLLTTNGVMVAAKSPTAAGIRPIRIDIPRIGRAFTFTKVLNVGNESLAVRTSIMKLGTFRTLQMIWQTVAFLIGLGMFWALWNRAERSSFWLAVGAALVIVSVAGMLLTWRALGLVLIALPPLLVLVIVVWLLVRFGLRKKVAEVIPPIEPEATIPPAMALIALTLFIWNTQLGAAEQNFSAARPAFSKSVSIVSANYTGTVREKVAQFDAWVSLSALGTNQTVALFGDDVAIQQFEVAKGSATLMREGRGVSVLLTNAGMVELHFKLVAKVGGDVTKRRLEFTIPPALSSALNMTIDEAEADVEFPTAVAFARTNVNQQTRVTAVLGSTDRVEMNWTPRVKRAAEIAATVFAQNTALVSFGSGVVNTRATFEYQVTQGE
ncbi:MAG TPA: type II secretion system protein, partial [Verrucomicrobiae bacterium]